MESFQKRPLQSHFPTIIQRKPHIQSSHPISQATHNLKTLLFKDNFYSFILTNYLCKSKTFALSTVFIMGNKRNRRSRKVESQSSDREECTSETSFTQGNVTLVDISENINDIFDRNLGSELTEPSQTSYEIEASPQRSSEQNSHKMTQIEQQLNSKFEEMLKEIRTKRDSNLAIGEEDAEKK